MTSPLLRAELDKFGETLTRNFAAAGAVRAQPEDQLKPPVVELVQEAGRLLAVGDVDARTEAIVAELGVRPDVGVSVAQLLTGHIELKAPGKGARARAFTDEHDRAQFKRLAGHPNLLYTDGNEWALYRNGAGVGSVVRASGDVRTAGVSSYTDAECIAIEALLRDFFLWQPIVPGSPRALAETLAPLTRLLREAVEVALHDDQSNLAQLAGEWRSIFFPDADDAQFADAYAQTVTYALLLARVEGETELRDHAADRLDARHDLLAQVLRVLAQASARAEVEVPISLLERTIGAVDPAELARRARGRDIWLYFYEDFLAAYDPKLRRQSGVYYTPAEVVEAQIALVAELLRERFASSTRLRRSRASSCSTRRWEPGRTCSPRSSTGPRLPRRRSAPLRGRSGPRRWPRNLHGFEILDRPVRRRAAPPGAARTGARRRAAGRRAAGAS